MSILYSVSFLFFVFCLQICHSVLTKRLSFVCTTTLRPVSRLSAWQVVYCPAALHQNCVYFCLVAARCRRWRRSRPYAAESTAVARVACRSREAHSSRPCSFRSTTSFYPTAGHRGSFALSLLRTIWYLARRRNAGDMAV